MHEEAYQFVARCLQELNPSGESLLAIEFGSFNVNGTVRDLFWDQSSYVGLDVRDGPGVDFIWDGLSIPEDLHGRVDVALSTETLEHAPEPLLLLQAMAQCLRPGGYLIVTAASPEREPHGCDGGALPAGEHYGALAPEWLRSQAEFVNMFEWMRVEHYPRRGDIYLFARLR